MTDTPNTVVAFRRPARAEPPVAGQCGDAALMALTRALARDAARADCAAAIRQSTESRGRRS